MMSFFPWSAFLSSAFKSESSHADFVLVVMANNVRMPKVHSDKRHTVSLLTIMSTFFA